jgi:hypothetical protein
MHESVARHIENLSPPFPDWAEWELTDPIDERNRLIFVRGAPEPGGPVIECFYEPRLPHTKGSSPVGHLWAFGWWEAACRGGTAPFLGRGRAIDSAEERMEQHGVWRGW